MPLNLNAFEVVNAISTVISPFITFYKTEIMGLCKLRREICRVVQI